MNVRETIEQISGDMGTQCSVLISTDEGTTVHIDQDIYRNTRPGDEHPYMFFPKDADPVYFDAEHIEQIIITRNGICIHISA